MKPRWIDVSVPLFGDMPHWPGDPPFRIHRVKRLERGDPANLSRISTTTHIGTHMDAPVHFIKGGAAIESLPLENAVGPARVVLIRNPTAVTVEEIRRKGIRRGERLLFKTRNSGRCWKSRRFLRDFVSISMEAARWLAEKRALCVGVDYLSVGGFADDGAAVHRALLERGVWIIEGLNLQNVSPGRYELVCLPLKILGADGAPARAILRPLR